MLDKLNKAWKQHQSVMVQMPTGTGKTHLMAEVIREASSLSLQGNDQGDEKGVLVVAHRRELIEQIKQTIDFFGIDRKKSLVYVESIQKLSRTSAHAVKCESAINPSLIIIDEAHHALAKTYKMLWDRWPEAKFMGLTATPCRLNNEGFLDLFQTLIQSHTIHEFIKTGWLSDFDYVTAEPDNPILKQVARLKKRGPDGDYQTKEMALAMDCKESIENMYQAYRKYVNGKKGIVYAIDREHARHITKYYQSKGLKCTMIDSNTQTKERDRLVQEYRSGGIDVVVNVNIFSEGFDCPEVEFIQLARPTLSLNKYLQQVGRGMRIARGKDKVVILDHVGMYQSFGLPTEDWDWQQMFTGRLAGKAGMGRQGLLYVRGDSREKEPVGVHMVHIKRKGEEHHGLEIFIQNGMYGIAKDGRVIHQPQFQRVRRADDGYFAYCTYPYLKDRSRVTIIDNDGRDLRLAMYGDLRWQDGSILKGQDVNGESLYWDRKYGTYYHEEPVFVTLGGIEMTRLKAGYVLRKYPALIKPTKKRDIFYNHKIIWMSDWLISKFDTSADTDYSPHRILSYGFYHFYVRTEKKDLPSVTIIDTNGNFVERRWSVPDKELHKTPLWHRTSLINALTGKAGFPDGR